jgi:hypothetical protein
VEAVKSVYKRVAEMVDELIGALGTQENKAIKIALANHPRVNRCFDLLGLTYPNWPEVDLKDAGGGRKRKRAARRDKGTGTSKGGGRGCGRGSSVDRPVAAKVHASSVAPSIASAMPRPMAAVAPLSSTTRVSLPARKMPGLDSVPILHDISSDDDEEEEERESSEGLEDVKVDGSSSDSSGSSASGDDDNDDDDDDDREGSNDVQCQVSKELRLQSGRAKAEREI